MNRSNTETKVTGGVFNVMLLVVSYIYLPIQDGETNIKPPIFDSETNIIHK